MRLRSLHYVLALLVAGLTTGTLAPAQETHQEPAIAAPHAEQGDAAAGASDAPHHAEAGHAAHGGIDYNKPPIQPDRRMLELFVFSLLLFVGFLLLARGMVWGPLIRALDQREARVNQAHAAAKAAQVEATRLLASYDEKMAEVHEQVKGIVARARQEADKEKVLIIAAAESDARALRDAALVEIQRAQEEAVAELLATADRHAELAAEHVVGQRFGSA